METLFLDATKNALERCINANINVYIKHNTLNVEITTTGLRCWRGTVDNFYEKIMIGLTVSEVCEEVVKKYKTYVMNAYFSKKYRK